MAEYSRAAIIEVPSDERLRLLADESVSRTHRIAGVVTPARWSSRRFRERLGPDDRQGGRSPEFACTPIAAPSGLSRRARSSLHSAQGAMRFEARVIIEFPSARLGSRISAPDLSKWGSQLRSRHWPGATVSFAEDLQLGLPRRLARPRLLDDVPSRASSYLTPRGERRHRR